MKLKSKSILLAITLCVFFLQFHYLFYIRHFETPFLESPFFSPAPEPLNIKKLVLTKTLYPTHLNPFQKFEYHYAEKGGNKTAVIEQSSMFKTDMDVIYGDYLKYYDPNVDGMFAKGFVVDYYPNGLFFLVEDFIIMAFIFVVTHRIVQLKKS